MQIEDLDETLTFALDVARAASEPILQHYRNCAIRLKSDGTEVTRADREAETVMREMIMDRFPEHAILGEEFGGARALQGSRQWILDPIDGTTWFALGMPVFGTLVAYLEEDEPVIGVIHFPALDETIFAARGSGCWYQCNGQLPQRVRVANTTALEAAVVSASGIHGSDISPETSDVTYRLGPVIEKARKFRFCGDCMQHALVCRGNVHVAIDTMMQPWDIAALIPCIEEAGGVATALDGKRKDIVFSGSLLTSSSSQIHQETLDLLHS